MSEAGPAFVPPFMRKRIERAIHEALHPKGMSTHSGIAAVQTADVQRLLAAVDALTAERDAAQAGLAAAVQAMNASTTICPVCKYVPIAYTHGVLPHWSTCVFGADAARAAVAQVEWLKRERDAAMEGLNVVADERDQFQHDRDVSRETLEHLSECWREREQRMLANNATQRARADRLEAALQLTPEEQINVSDYEHSRDSLTEPESPHRAAYNLYKIIRRQREALAATPQERGDG